MNIFTEDTNLLPFQYIEILEIEEYLLLVLPCGGILNYIHHRQITFVLLNSFAQDTNHLADKGFEMQTMLKYVLLVPPSGHILN